MSVGMGRYSKVALGGTFDGLHKGHKRLIEKALEIGEKVLIGVTTDEMLKREPKPHSVDGYGDRVKKLNVFLKEIGAIDRVVLTSLNDHYGPALRDGGIEVLVVSRETASRAREINRLRVKRGLKPLKLMVMNMVLADDGAPISTTRIKSGEIDSEGRLLH